MSWADRPIYFIDFEGNATSGIIEFGVVTLIGGKITATRTRFCSAVGRISPEDTAVHGLRAEQIATAAIFKEEWDYFSGLRSSGPLAAHFAQAENYLLKTVWAYPQTVPDFARPGQVTTEWGPWIDTGRLYPQIFPALGDGKLEELVAACGLQVELDELAQLHCPVGRQHYHAALYDALGGALLLRSLLVRPEFKAATLPWLLQMSTLDGDKRSALQQGNLW
ncbi:MAG: 3'-5' exonuclease [Opitutaceae bacterium]|jgi:DNA polymerase-3 subunit epsilon|nr:3'-5' exonuclease [Opitutaceae bacterium]NBR58995.1 3'-5' exonuclease [Opitutaceae bacterium]